jgi:hypothetical protein
MPSASASAARQFTAELYLPFKASSSAGSKPFLFWGLLTVKFPKFLSADQWACFLSSPFMLSDLDDLKIFFFIEVAQVALGRKVAKRVKHGPDSDDAR